MRNFKCYIADLRKRVFAEVARLAYEGGDYRRMEKLPYEIVPGEVGNERSSIFLERAIVGERIRLAMGLPLRPVAEHSLLSDGIEESAVAEKYYDPPLVNIIKYACNGCTPTHFEVTNACQGCLSRHCQNACPKGRYRHRPQRPRLHRPEQVHQVRQVQGRLLLSGHHQVHPPLSGGLRHERHRAG